MAEVLDEAFAAAKRRDPQGERSWVMLVDGEEEQLRQQWVQQTAHGMLRRPLEPEVAEALLQLRALRISGDWDCYLAFHKTQERLRNYPEYPDQERVVV